MIWGYLAAVVSVTLRAATFVEAHSSACKGLLILLLAFARHLQASVRVGVFFFPAYVNYFLNFLRKAVVPILKSILSLIYSTNT